MGLALNAHLGHTSREAKLSGAQIRQQGLEVFAVTVDEVVALFILGCGEFVGEKKCEEVVSPREQRAQSRLILDTSCKRAPPREREREEKEERSLWSSSVSHSCREPRQTDVELHDAASLGQAGLVRIRALLGERFRQGSGAHLEKMAQGGLEVGMNLLGHRRDDTSRPARACATRLVDLPIGGEGGGQHWRVFCGGGGGGGGGVARML